MSQPVHVGSIAAIRDFRAALANYGGAAKQILDEVEANLRRVANWIRHDQLVYWKTEVRRASDGVSRARAELERCQNNTLEGQRPTCLRERKLYEAARQYVRHAEERVQVVRRWAGRIEQVISEYKGGVASLQNRLEGDLPGSLALLERMVIALESYAALDPAKEINARSAAESEAATSMARAPAEFLDDENSVAPDTSNRWKQLRQRAPSAQERETLPFEASAYEAPAKDMLRLFEDEAAETAAGLGQLALPVDWSAKVMLDAGALDAGEFYAQRIETGAEGDSGWFVAPVEPSQGSLQDGGPRYESASLGEVARRRAPLHRALALSPGFLVVICDEEVVAVLDEHDNDMWAKRTAS